MMKPSKTWIVLADAQAVRIVANDGPSKGLYGVSTKGLDAPPVTKLSDAPGMTKAPVGPDRGSISEHDLKTQAATSFADAILDVLTAAHGKDAFQQLVFIASPTMLGILRQRMPRPLADIMRSEIAKDLTQIPIADLPEHLADVLAV
ncbi:MAG: protein required for attachment to host cells [Yoonia sp.]|jgi:protein required for attachment to host cells